MSEMQEAFESVAQYSSAVLSLPQEKIDSPEEDEYGGFPAHRRESIRPGLSYSRRPGFQSTQKEPVKLSSRRNSGGSLHYRKAASNLLGLG